MTSRLCSSIPRCSMPRNLCVSGKGTLPTTNPVKKKLTHAAVSICGTIMFRFFFNMSVIMLGSLIIC